MKKAIGLACALGLLLGAAAWAEDQPEKEAPKPPVRVPVPGMPMVRPTPGLARPEKTPSETGSEAPGAAAKGQGGDLLKTSGEKYVGLNFDFADISVVIQTIADLLNMNYILSPGISGKVTIQTSGKVAIADLPFVLDKILEVNNLAAVPAGDFIKIIPLGSVARETLEIIGADEAVPKEKTVIKIFKLKSTTPSEVSRIFGSLKSPQGLFIPHDAAGILIVLDSASRMSMFSELIDAVDVDLYQNVHVELFPVANAQAEELAKDLIQVLTAVTTVPGRPAARYKLIPIKAINSLLFVSSEAGLDKYVSTWIKELDQPPTIEAEKIFVYNLNHASSENVASILRELYSEKSGAVAKTPSAPSAAKDRQPAPGEPAAMPAAAAAPIIAVGDIGVSGKVKIVADKDTNSLIIQTAPWNYPSIMETIKKLDKMPSQVLIEVTIAEISLDDEDKYGIQWQLLSQGSANVGPETFNVSARTQMVTSGLAAGSGLSYMVAEAGRLTAVLNAYAKASKLNIISRPHILASDNKEAKIDIGQEVPIITTMTTSQSQTGTTTQNVDKTVEYRSTGVILTVTPHVNVNRDVTLDVNQEVSEAQKNEISGTDSPIIRKRSAKTTMVVKDNQSLVIGGLMQEKRDKSREGIPLLSRIPFLGWLFGTTGQTLSKTELVILLTPRVVATAEEGTKLTEEIKERSVILKKGLSLP